MMQFFGITREFNYYFLLFSWLLVSILLRTNYDQNTFRYNYCEFFLAYILMLPSQARVILWELILCGLFNIPDFCLFIPILISNLYFLLISSYPFIFSLIRSPNFKFYGPFSDYVLYSCLILFLISSSLSGDICKRIPFAWLRHSNNLYDFINLDRYYYVFLVTIVY